MTRESSQEKAAFQETPRVSPVASCLKHVERLMQIKGEFNRLPFESTGDQEVEFAVFGSHGSVADDGSRLVASVDLGFRISALPDVGAEIPAEFLQEQTGRMILAYVRAGYLITYALNGGGNLSDEDVEEFCRVNAVHTAWPFWREFVTSSLSRGGLDSVPVPMFNVYGSQPRAVRYISETTEPPKG
jgi:hypothetical protein